MRRGLSRSVALGPLALAAVFCGAALVPAQDAERRDEGGAVAVTEAAAETVAVAETVAGAVAETEAAAETVAVTEAAAESELVLAPSLLSIGAVVLSDRMPEAWWSDTTDSWPLEPARQRRRMPRRCRTRGGYREHCSGERIVATPSPLAAAMAERFGLGQRGTAMAMMHEEPYEEWLALVADADDETDLDWPVENGRRGRGFGYTRTGELRGRRHNGIDIGAPEGSPVHAARGGLVVYSDNHITGYGNMVIVLHRDGAATFYGHCRATLVAAGTYVERGDVIAEVGETGFAPAPHLHFEHRRSGHARDPMRAVIRETMHTDAETADDEIDAGDEAEADDDAVGP